MDPTRASPFRTAATISALHHQAGRTKTLDLTPEIGQRKSSVSGGVHTRNCRINGTLLEHRGLNRVRLRGPDGFERAVGLSVLASNLHRIGQILRGRERERMRLERETMRDERKRLEQNRKRMRRDRGPLHQYRRLRAA